MFIMFINISLTIGLQFIALTSNSQNTMVFINHDMKLLMGYKQFGENNTEQP